MRDSVTQDLSASCSTCSELVKASVEQENYRSECRACNLGVFSTGCDCSWESREVTHVTCTSCNVYEVRSGKWSLKDCEDCGKRLLGEPKHRLCNACLANHNPNTDTAKYELRNYVWVPTEERVACPTCGYARFVSFGVTWTCDACQEAETLAEYSKQYPEWKWAVSDNGVRFQGTCSCGEELPWLHPSELESFKSDWKKNTCRKCDPSTPRKYYFYYKYSREHGHTHLWGWRLEEVSCLGCEDFVPATWATKRCRGCPPPASRWVKLNFSTNSGWHVARVLVAGTGGHRWQSAFGNDVTLDADYRCGCDKCRA